MKNAYIISFSSDVVVFFHNCWRNFISDAVKACKVLLGRYTSKADLFVYPSCDWLRTVVVTHLMVR